MHKILFVKVIYTLILISHGSIKAIKLSGGFKGENLKLFKHIFPYTTNYQVHEEFKVETVKESNLDPYRGSFLVNNKQKLEFNVCGHIKQVHYKRLV